MIFTFLFIDLIMTLFKNEKSSKFIIKKSICRCPFNWKRDTLTISERGRGREVRIKLKLIDVFLCKLKWQTSFNHCTRSSTRIESARSKSNDAQSLPFRHSECLSAGIMENGIDLLQHASNESKPKK